MKELVSDELYPITRVFKRKDERSCPYRRTRKWNTQTNEKLLRGHQSQRRKNIKINPVQ